MSGRVLSVNVSPVRSVEMRGKSVTTGIYKIPVARRVPLRGVNLRGDDQADRNARGGPDRAVYAYASEDYRWWEASLERTLDAGTFGENLTLGGVDVSGALIGERWRAGATLPQNHGAPRAVLRTCARERSVDDDNVMIGGAAAWL